MTEGKYQCYLPLYTPFNVSVYISFSFFTAFAFFFCQKFIIHYRLLFNLSILTNNDLTFASRIPLHRQGLLLSQGQEHQKTNLLQIAYILTQGTNYNPGHNILALSNNFA